MEGNNIIGKNLDKKKPGKKRKEKRREGRIGREEKGGKGIQEREEEGREKIGGGRWNGEGRRKDKRRAKSRKSPVFA